MIIDYFECRAYEMFFSNAAKPPERCGVEAWKDYGIYAKYIDHVMNPEEGGGPRYMRYVDFYPTEVQQEEYTVTKKAGPFGLFSKQVLMARDKQVVDYSRKARFSIRGSLFQYEEHTSNIGIFEIVDTYEQKYKLLYDVVTGLPCIERQPTTLQEIQTLLHADPRFIAYVDPAIIRAEEIARGHELGGVIIHAAQIGLNRILESQARVGVVFDEAEREERKAFVDECVMALQSFQESYAEMTAGGYDLKMQASMLEEKPEAVEKLEESSLDVGNSLDEDVSTSDND